jgi:serine 3-dehydrogenase (NADP+)
MITGATSGFGLAAARRFAKAGYRVVVTGRRADRLEALAAELGAENAVASVFDIQDSAAMDAALAALPEKFRDIDVLVNNAGLALGTAPAPKASLEEWITMIQTNVTGLVTLTHRLLPTIIKRKGTILNLSSVAATYPYPGGNVYGASKAFVSQFSLGLRSDLHGTGVRVCSLEPGMAETEFMLVRSGGNQGASEALYKGAHPLRPEDVAEALFWVASLPPHVNVNRLEMMTVNQSWPPFQVHRE